MIYKNKEILYKLKDQYNKCPKDYYYSISIGPYYSTPQQEILLKDICVDLNASNMTKFLYRSNPKLIFSDELIKVKIGNEEGLFTINMLQDLTAKDVYDLFSIDQLKSNPSITMTIVETNEKRKYFEKNMEMFADIYCDSMNTLVNVITKKRTKENFKDDVVYLLDCTDHESALVFDGFNCVAMGNYWDFHEGCCGLSKYKKIDLSDWEGAGNLASILSNGLKKQKKSFKISDSEYELFIGGGYVEKQSNTIDKVNTIEKLLIDNKNKKDQVQKDKLKNLQKKDMNVNELMEEFKLKYGQKFCDKNVFLDEEENQISINEGIFLTHNDMIDSDFQEFIDQCKGWYIDFLYSSTLVICRLY